MNSKVNSEMYAIKSAFCLHYNIQRIGEINQQTSQMIFIQTYMHKIGNSNLNSFRYTRVEE